MFITKSKCEKCGSDLYDNEFSNDVTHINFYLLKVRKSVEDKQFISEMVICPKCYHDRKLHNRHHVHKSTKKVTTEEVVEE